MRLTHYVGVVPPLKTTTLHQLMAEEPKGEEEVVLDPEEEEGNEGEGENEGETPEQKAARLEEANKKLFARAKKAEGFVLEDGKWVKKPKPAAEPNNAQGTTDPEELKLIARGLSDEAIEQAKSIAKGKGITLVEAMKDPLFTAWKKEADEAAKREEARLGASKGSGEGEGQSNFDTGLTDEGGKKHKEAWKGAVGKK